MRILHDLDPYIFQLPGGFGVRWYSLPYMLGIVLVYVWLWRSTRRREITNLTADNLESLVIWAVVGTVVGARFFHVFVFKYSRYGFDPLAWINIARGGMAFHGASSVARSGSGSSLDVMRSSSIPSRTAS